MFAVADLDEAKDLIDIYGPDEVFWPSEHAPLLKRLVANDTEFRSYVDDAKWLEDMLSDWEQTDDGAAIDFDPQDDSDVQTTFDPQMTPTSGNSATGSNGANDEDEEQTAIREITFDPSKLQDMDAMLGDFIRKQIEQDNPDEFRVFTRDYDRIVDIKLPAVVSVEAIDQQVAKTTGPLQKDLRRMIAARSLAKRLPGKRSGRLHSPNLHRLIAGDDRVFFRREEGASMDTAISLVIDCSGSMAGTRLKLATEAAYALGSVLSRLGIEFECLGFTDAYKDPCMDKRYHKDLEAANAIAPITRFTPIVMPRFKEFHERWTHPVQKRFAHVFNANGYNSCGIDMGGTPEGCGMEFAARRLLQRKESRKIMITMTDGEPGSSSYNGNNYGGWQKHSTDMVKSIEASGIDLVGIGIQHSGPKNYYTNAIVINSLDELPKQLLALLKGLIK